jgi:uncharacterized protein (TIGR02246 family)
MFALVFSLVAAAGTGAATTAQNNADIAAQDKAWEKAFNAGDPVQLASLYTEDARLLAPNTVMARGQAAIRPALDQMVATGLKVTLNSIEAMAAGDLGYSVGVYEFRDASGAVVDRGKYIGVMRNVDGQWKLTNDTWNSDMPAAGTGLAQMIIVHKVKDDAHWLAAWDGEHGRRELFAQHGAPSVTIFGCDDLPNQHALLVEVADMDAFHAWATSPAVAAAKAEDGVIDEGFMIFTPRK